MTSASTISALPPSYPTIAATPTSTSFTTTPPDATSASAASAPDTTNTSTPINPNPTPDQNTVDTAQPSAYNALANANSSTIRGANLNIQA